MQKLNKFDLLKKDKNTYFYVADKIGMPDLISFSYVYPCRTVIPLAPYIKITVLESLLQSAMDDAEDITIPLIDDGCSGIMVAVDTVRIIELNMDNQSVPEKVMNSVKEGCNIYPAIVNDIFIGKLLSNSLKYICKQFNIREWPYDTRYSYNTEQ